MPIISKLCFIKRNLLKLLHTTGENIGQKVVRGSIWVFALRITQQLINIIRTIILARILSPNDFGLFGIALLAMSALETFSQTGFQQALVQKKGDVTPYLDTAWTVQIVRGLFLAFLLFIIAPYAAAFFGEPRAVPLLKVLGLALIFQGFTNIGVIFFQKELEFSKQFIYQFSGTIVDLAVSVTAAIMLKNTWALILGLVAANLARMVMSYLVHPYRPHISINKDQTRELFSFGKWIFGSSVLGFLVTEGDDLLVGKILGATSLGIYQLAYRISNAPATEVTHVISQVTFPAYSRLQDNIEALREAYLKVLQVTMLIYVPTTVLIFFLSPVFTQAFLGDKWMPMVQAMQVLVLAGLVRSVAASAGYVFHSVGKPAIDTWLQLLRLGVLSATIYPLTMKWGIIGSSVSVLISIIISSIGFGYMVMRVTKASIEQLLTYVSIPCLSGIVVLALALLMNNYQANNALLQVVVFGILILGLYGFLVCFFDRHFNHGICATLKKALAGAR